MIKLTEATTSYSYGINFNAQEAVFKEGRITAIIGRNGSGKSTILKAIMGQMRYGGSIKIDDTETRDYSHINRAKKVAFLPQSLKTVNLDVESLVEHGRYSYHGNFRRITSKDKEYIKRALEITHIEELSDRELKEISLGERQRAYLAMVIAQNSKMILLDEPTTYMDHENNELFYEILKTLKKEGTGIVMVCHDLEQSLAYSDEIYIMENRNLFYAGTPDEVALNEELMRRNFGVGIKKVMDEELLYPYIMTK